MSDLRHRLSTLTPEALFHVNAEIDRALEATLAVSLGQDQRATTLAGVFAAAAAALIAGLSALLASPSPDPLLLWPTLAAAPGFLVAACLAAWATSPRDFWLPGFDPHHMIAVEGITDIPWAEVVTRKQRWLDQNRKVLLRSARLTSYGFLAAGVALAAAPLALLAAYFLTC